MADEVEVLVVFSVLILGLCLIRLRRPNTRATIKKTKTLWVWEIFRQRKLQGNYHNYRGQLKAGTGHKMLSTPFFFSTSCFQGPAFGWDKIVVIVTLLARMYRWLSWIWEKHKAMKGIQGKDSNFLGNLSFPNLYERLLHERKLKSGYLERRIYERPLKSEPFIENQSEHISKLSLHRSLVKRKFITRRYRPAREPSRISLRFLRRHKNKNSMLKKFLFKRISSILIPKSSKLHRYICYKG